MTRYVRQPSKYSCGPTAIINSVKWAGNRCSVKGYHTFISRLCNSSYEFGTEEADFGRVLRLMLGRSHPRVTVWKRSRLAPKRILEHIRKPGCAAVVLYWRPSAGYETNRKKVDGHYELVVDGPGGDVQLINDRKDETITVISKEKFTGRLNFKRRSKLDFPQVWLLRKR